MRKLSFVILCALLCVSIIAGIAYSDTRSDWIRSTASGNNQYFWDTQYSPSYLSIWNKAPLTAALNPAVGFFFTEDFIADTDTTLTWTIEADDVGGYHAVEDSLGGVYKLTTHSTDNDEAYLYTSNKSFRFQSGSPLFAEVRLILAEDADSTYAGNFIVGFTDTTVSGGNMLLDNGGGPPASSDGCYFYKVDKATAWSTETSNGTTQESNANVATRSTTAYHTLGILYDGTSSVEFYIDNALEATHSTTVPDGTMRFVVGAKTGAAVAAGMYVDYIKIFQVR